MGGPSAALPSAAVAALPRLCMLFTPSTAAAILRVQQGLRTSLMLTIAPAGRLKVWLPHRQLRLLSPDPARHAASSEVSKSSPPHRTIISISLAVLASGCQDRFTACQSGAEVSGGFAALPAGGFRCVNCPSMFLRRQFRWPARPVKKVCDSVPKRSPDLAEAVPRSRHARPQQPRCDSDVVGFGHGNNADSARPHQQRCRHITSPPGLHLPRSASVLPCSGLD
jgi:hypothetical protein